MNASSSSYKGYRGQSLVINLNNNAIKKISTEKEMIDKYLGGRGWAIKYLFDNLNQGIAPLEQENILVISLGPLTGTLAPSTARYTIF